MLDNNPPIIISNSPIEVENVDNSTSNHLNFHENIAGNLCKVIYNLSIYYIFNPKYTVVLFLQVIILMHWIKYRKSGKIMQL